jgi:16S rRNA processing protein RimM
MTRTGRPPLASIGRLGKAHGIRGELVFTLTADSPDLLGGELILKARDREEERRLELAGVRRHHDKLLVSFKGVDTRNAAELLRSHEVFVPRDRLPPLADDEVYLSDLPGLRVFLPAGEGERSPRKAREIGRIQSVDAPAGQALWTILTPEGREILFPAAEEFVIAVNLEENMAVIDPPPGLLDLYLADSAP